MELDNSSPPVWYGEVVGKPQLFTMKFAEVPRLKRDVPQDHIQLDNELRRKKGSPGNLFPL
jgi:hypothetical protein